MLGWLLGVRNQATGNILWLEHGTYAHSMLEPKLSQPSFSPHPLHSCRTCWYCWGKKGRPRREFSGNRATVRTCGRSESSSTAAWRWTWRPSQPCFSSAWSKWVEAGVILRKTRHRFKCWFSSVSRVWQSFLKELPGSLLVSDLYDDWMAALDSEDHQQRVLEITR